MNRLKVSFSGRRESGGRQGMQSEVESVALQ